jgi:Cof subfamily protein (haloacid dehalogenase superfamily)
VIRLIALDLDGTLFGPDWRVGETDRAAVVAARDRGIQISLATSRWYGSAHTMARELELRAPLICQNGAHVKEPNDGTELLHLRIPTEVARELAAFCDDGRFETYTTVDSVTYVRTAREAQMKSRRLPQEMRLARTHAEYITGPASGFVVFGRESVQAVIKAFAERYADVLAMPSGVSETFPPYVTITAAGTDKGRALDLVCRHLGVSPEEAMAIGDAAPDVAMFEVAGIGVAMGNAPEDVQAKADAVAPSNAEAGVAWAIRRFVLDSG